MATIERMIGEWRWAVAANGVVQRAMATVLDCDGEPASSMWKASVLRQAFALRDEWEALEREEKLHAPPTVKLPEWAKFARQGKASATHEEWVIDYNDIGVSLCAIRVYKKGSHGYLVQGLAIAAADELEARRKGNV